MSFIVVEVEDGLNKVMKKQARMSL